MLGKLIAVALVAEAAAYCAVGTGGTCNHFSCSSSHGKTECQSGSCVCAEGYCATLGTCYKKEKCEKDTGGTCSMLGCKGWRGDTKCIGGKCLCAHGGCVLGDTGMCSYACEKNSGGTCSMLSCKSSRGPTDCVSGKCLCKHGYCASNGVCYPHSEDLVETFTNTTELPAFWLDDAQIGNRFHIEPTAGAFAAATCIASVSIVLGVAVWRRRRQKGELSDALLPGYVPEESVSS